MNDYDSLPMEEEVVTSSTVVDWPTGVVVVVLVRLVAVSSEKF